MSYLNMDLVLNYSNYRNYEYSHYKNNLHMSES